MVESRSHNGLLRCVVLRENIEQRIVHSEISKIDLPATTPGLPPIVINLTLEASQSVPNEDVASLQLGSF